jgi:hypothetical protein
MNCPKCGERIEWERINNNLCLSSDCLYVQAEFNCGECKRDLSVTYDVTEFGIEDMGD